MPPSRKDRVRRPHDAGPKWTTPPSSPHLVGEPDPPHAPPDPLDPIHPDWCYSLEGDEVDELYVDCRHTSVAECVLNALLIGPGDYIVRREERRSPLWHLRVTEEIHRDALRSLADLLARLYPGMPRHLPEPRT